MSARRRTLAAASTLAALSLLLAACGGGDDDEEVRQPTSPTDAVSTANALTLNGQWPLTGEKLEGDLPEHPVYVVKIDNTSSSAPQLGLGPGRHGGRGAGRGRARPDSRRSSTRTPRTSSARCARCGPPTSGSSPLSTPCSSPPAVPTPPSSGSPRRTSQTIGFEDPNMQRDELSVGAVQPVRSPGRHRQGPRLGLEAAVDHVLPVR